MSKLIVEGNLSAQLRALSQPVQLCDPHGQVLGQFIPAVNRSQGDIDEPPLDREEIERRKATAKRLSTEEFIDELEKL